MRHHTTSYCVVRLVLIAPMILWQNSTPFWCKTSLWELKIVIVWKLCKYCYFHLHEQWTRVTLIESYKHFQQKMQTFTKVLTFFSKSLNFLPKVGTFCKKCRLLKNLYFSQRKSADFFKNSDFWKKSWLFSKSLYFL